MADHRTILLVEDNPDDEALTLRALKKRNIINPVTVAHDGLEALQYLHGEGYLNQPKPALILLDLKLPKLDGLEVLRRIRADERTALIPVVILTSSKEESDLANGYRNGCNSYIRKPVDFDEFLDVMGQLGIYWLLLNETPNP